MPNSLPFLPLKTSNARQNFHSVGRMFYVVLRHFYRFFPQNRAVFGLKPAFQGLKPVFNYACFSRIAACAAASLAMGTLNGEQET